MKKSTLLFLVFVFSAASAAYSSCTPPTTEQIYTTCPEPNASVISVTDSPFCASAQGDAAHDATVAFQSALNAAQVCEVPVNVPSGYYFISQSLHLAGDEPSTVTPYPVELSGYGGNANVEGALTENYPLIDATGCENCKIHDLYLTANPPSLGGIASATILLGATSPNNLGNNVVLYNLFIESNAPAVASLVNEGSDRMDLRNSGGNGPNEIIISAANIAGVNSKFNVLVANTSSAYQTPISASLEDDEFGSAGYSSSAPNGLPLDGTGIWMDDITSLSLQSVYVNSANNSSSAIKMTAQKDANNNYIITNDTLYMDDFREEPNGLAAGQTLHAIDIEPGVDTQHGFISGVLDAAGTNGSYIYLPVGAKMDSYKVNAGIGNAFPLIAGDIDSNGNQQVGVVVNSEFNAPGVAGFLGAGSEANKLIAYYGKPWTYPPGAFASIINGDSDVLGPGVTLTSIDSNNGGGGGLIYQNTGANVAPGQNRDYTVAFPTALNNPTHTVVNCEVIDTNSPPCLVKFGVGAKTANGITVTVKNTCTVQATGTINCTEISQ